VFGRHIFETGLRYNSRMNERQLAAQLRRECFSHTYVWEDGANAFYPEHTHPMETAHIILDGEMTLSMNGKAQTLRAGARCDVPAGTIHSAKMGACGCRYLIGER
jgi:mannose-6-phosphate isomerase-like protein (cupin superfamily)